MSIYRFVFLLKYTSIYVKKEISTLSSTILYSSIQKVSSIFEKPRPNFQNLKLMSSRMTDGRSKSQLVRCKENSKERKWDQCNKLKRGYSNNWIQGEYWNCTKNSCRTLGKYIPLVLESILALSSHYQSEAISSRYTQMEN